MVKKCLSVFCLFACLGTLFLGACAAGGADEKYFFPKKEETGMEQAYTESGISFDDSLWTAPAVTETGLDALLGTDAQVSVSDSRIRAILYDGVPLGEKQTKVFAYVGFPEGASEEAPVPAVVLVHGGEGTAFWDWVAMWLDRGYAAIAMDTEGRFPTQGSEMANGYRALLPQEMRGPQNSGYYADATSPAEQQWMYHAVASVIAANSYLRSCPQVDASAVGMVGVSWGGVICSIANIYDDRFAFAAPIYGGLNMAGTPCNFGNIYASVPQALLWDDGQGLLQCETPTFYVNGGSDYHFNVQGTFRCAADTPNARVLVKKTLEHSQYSAACVQEVYAFADHVVKREQPFFNIEKQPTKGEPVLRLDLPKGVSVKKAELLYSESDTATNWKSLPLEGGAEISFEVPSAAKYFFVNVTDSNGFSCSSALQTM